MTTSAAEMARNVANLASFPDLAFKINDAIISDHSDAAHVATLVRLDPALSAKLLKIANSPAFGFSGNIASIERAVSLVGTHKIRDLAFGIYATKAFAGISNELIDVEDFWRHGLLCAWIAESLSKQLGVCSGEPVFTAALLSDVGQLVMFNQCPKQSSEALKNSIDNNEGLELHLSEREVFGFDHSDVGWELAKRWRFPESISDPIAQNHGPFSAMSELSITHLVHVASSLAVLAELDEDDIEMAPPIDNHLVKFFDFSQAPIRHIVNQAIKSSDEILNAILNS